MPRGIASLNNSPVCMNVCGPPRADRNATQDLTPSSPNNQLAVYPSNSQLGGVPLPPNFNPATDLQRWEFEKNADGSSRGTGEMNPNRTLCPNCNVAFASREAMLHHQGDNRKACRFCFKERIVCNEGVTARELKPYCVSVCLPHGMCFNSAWELGEHDRVKH